MTLQQRGEAENPQSWALWPLQPSRCSGRPSLASSMPHCLLTRSHRLSVLAFLSFEVSLLNLLAESPRQSALLPEDTGQAVAVPALEPESRCRPGRSRDSTAAWIPSPCVCP